MMIILPGQNMRIALGAFIASLLSLFDRAAASYSVVYAINAGGDDHVSAEGIHYHKDPLTSVGIASDFGKQMPIARIGEQDQILYQTERYHTSNFGYRIPIAKDGNYVLVLKFSEVWFAASNQKVFDIVVNGDHTVVDGLDIYKKVGRATAHDEVVPFSIKNGHLNIQGEKSKMGGELSIEFIKTAFDNPKINAILLIKGSVDDIPVLPPLPDPDFNEDDDTEVAVDEEEEPAPPQSSPTDYDPVTRQRKTSGAPVDDPYSMEDMNNTFWPILVAIAAFIPLLYCICKL